MKRIIAVLLVISLLFAFLCGCDNKDNSSDISSNGLLYQNGDNIIEDTDFYRIIYNKNTYMYKYEIFDTDGNILESDTTNRQPHISLLNDKIIWFWAQSGTGALTRWAYFYNTTTGQKSPTYSGVTDCLDNFVLTMTTDMVHISDMFTGKSLQTFYEFEKGLSPDYHEKIIWAQFADDGYSVKVKYWSEKETEEIQVFDFTYNLQERLTNEIETDYKEEFKTAYSTADMYNINKKYADKWQEIAEKYYQKIINYDGILQTNENYYSSDDLHIFVANMKSNWEQYYKIESENYLKTLETIYQGGTIVVTLIGNHHYNTQKDWALQLVAIYEQL